MFAGKHFLGPNPLRLAFEKFQGKPAQTARLFGHGLNEPKQFHQSRIALDLLQQLGMLKIPDGSELGRDDFRPNGRDDISGVVDGETLRIHGHFWFLAARLPSVEGAP